MLNAFEAVPADARRGHLDEYRDFLRERDGELDLDRHTLANRERTMQRFETAVPKATLDAELFKQRYHQFDRRTPLSPEMTLLLALVKINGAEAFGVNLVFEEQLRRARATGDDIELMLLMEEHYHTRILLSTAQEFGLDVQETYRPPLSLRTLINTIAAVPVTMARPLTLASEVFGATAFHALLKKTGEILKHSPELRDAVEERIMEVLIDELGHVTFNRLGLGSWGLWQARTVLPLVAKGVGDFAPELGALGLTLNGDPRSLDDLPRQVRERAFMV